MIDGSLSTTGSKQVAVTALTSSTVSFIELSIRGHTDPISFTKSCHRIPKKNHYNKSNNHNNTERALTGCLGWGSHTSILTPYMKSTGLLTPSVKFSSNSVQPLQRYYNIKAHSNASMENSKLGNASNLMT